MAKRTEMGDLQREPERPKRNRAWGDREKPMGVETQGTREEKVRNRMGKGLPWRPSGQDPALPKQKARLPPVVGELRSHMLCGSANGQERKMTETE